MKLAETSRPINSNMESSSTWNLRCKEKKKFGVKSKKAEDKEFGYIA